MWPIKKMASQRHVLDFVELDRGGRTSGKKKKI